MDFRRNEDYYWRRNWYAAGVGDGLYNGCMNIAFSNEGAEPVTRDDFKQFAKIDNPDEDSLIDDLIPVARLMCEQYCNTGIITRSIVADINNANGGYRLPYGPVTNTPTAVDADNNTLTLTYNMGAIYEPRGRMTVTYNAGYHSTVLPQLYRIAILQQMTWLFENRGDITRSVKISPEAQVTLNPLIRQK